MTAVVPPLSYYITPRSYIIPPWSHIISPPPSYCCHKIIPLPLSYSIITPPPLYRAVALISSKLGELLWYKCMSLLIISRHVQPAHMMQGIWHQIWRHGITAAVTVAPPPSQCHRRRHMVSRRRRYNMMTAVVQYLMLDGGRMWRRWYHVIHVLPLSYYITPRSYIIPDHIIYHLCLHIVATRLSHCLGHILSSHHHLYMVPLPSYPPSGASWYGTNACHF